MAATAFDPGKSVLQAVSAAPEPGNVDIEAMVESAGPEVTVVNWIFQEVTGESLVEMVIEPITGDFNKIIQDANGWRQVSKAMTAMGDTMKANDDVLGQHWQGVASIAHKVYIDVGWKAGLFVEGKIAEAIGKGFDEVAKGSEKLCTEALKLLKKLIDKLISAISTSWIPVVGWARAVEMVWDAYQIYKAIMDIIEQVKNIIHAAQDIFTALKDIGSQLAKIKDIRSVDDAITVAEGVSGDVKKISGDVDTIQSSAGNIAKDGAKVGQNTASIGRNASAAGKDIGGKTGQRISQAGQAADKAGRKVQSVSDKTGNKINKVNKTIDKAQAPVDNVNNKVSDGIDKAKDVEGQVDETIGDINRGADMADDGAGLAERAGGENEVTDGVQEGADRVHSATGVVSGVLHGHSDDE